MASQLKRPADSYNPLYFLASVGAGGLSVTFFMYLMFWVPHKGRPVPIFEDITAAFQSGPLALQLAIALGVTGIAIFSFLNIKALLWNLSALARYRRSDAYEALSNSNAQASLLAAPLAAAMSVNAMFIVGLVFVPQLWTIVEYLFPLAMTAFVLIGLWSLRLIGGFLGRILSAPGQFNMAAHNSFAQMLPAFALAMVGVGLSAPSAMSTLPVVVGTSLVLSTLFGVMALLYAAFAALTGMSAMLQHGTAKEAAPTLMVVVPLMTVLGILFLRQNHGLHTSFGSHGTDGDTLVFLARLLAVQVAFLLLGLVVLKRQGYFTDYVFGSQTSPGSYALVCPGVALSVMVQFFVHKGLVSSGVIDKYSMTYWGLIGVALLAQALMVALVLRLNRQHFSRPPATRQVAAE